VPALTQTLRVRPGGELDRAPEGPALTAGLARLPFRDPSPATLATLEALASGAGVDADSLALDPSQAMLVHRLEAGGWVARTIASGPDELVTLEPLAFADVLSKRGFEPAAAVKLSRFAAIRTDGATLLLESGRARARARLHDPRLAALLGDLAEPKPAGDVDAEAAGLAPEAAESVLRLLQRGRLIERVDEGDPELEDPELAQWHPVDLLFHARSRLGRQAEPYGGTYPYKGIFPEPPSVRPESGELLELPRPELDDLRAAGGEMTLTEAIETRRSIRRHDDEAPIDAAQLGELLFRTSRLRGIVKTPNEPFALRPYPNGGALYELDVYPIVRLCEGVASGLYRYDPEAHGLRPLAEPAPPVHGLLEHAKVAALMEQQPQVLLVIAARFGRTTWKYEAVPYALTLKHVGVLYQTLYLVATAMGLAPCGLGGGDSELFSRAAGLDYEAETSVGEFIVGSPAGDPGPVVG
jgi:SagB-type dehydrogenase family enzyme